MLLYLYCNYSKKIIIDFMEKSKKAGFTFTDQYFSTLNKHQQKRIRRAAYFARKIGYVYYCG